MKAQLKDVQRALVATQRAYVNVQEVKVVTFEVGKYPEALITYRNAGLTPAKSVLAIPSSFIRLVQNGPVEPLPPCPIWLAAH
jgi:hypothetical protein